MDVTEFNKKALISLDESFSARPGGAKTAKIPRKGSGGWVACKKVSFIFYTPQPEGMPNGVPGRC
jgi:hypothetical protein